MICNYFSWLVVSYCAYYRNIYNSKFMQGSLLGGLFWDLQFPWFEASSFGNVSLMLTYLLRIIYSLFVLY